MKLYVAPKQRQVQPCGSRIDIRKFVLSNPLSSISILIRKDILAISRQCFTDEKQMTSGAGRRTMCVCTLLAGLHGLRFWPRRPRQARAADHRRRASSGSTGRRDGWSASGGRSLPRRAGTCNIE